MNETPIPTHGLIGPCTSGGCCAHKKAEPKICLSFRLTWLNIGSLVFLRSSFTRTQDPCYFSKILKADTDKYMRLQSLFTI